MTPVSAPASPTLVMSHAVQDGAHIGYVDPTVKWQPWFSGNNDDLRFPNQGGTA